MSITITLLGVGEAFDADEPNSAALVEAGGFTLLVDCGHSAVAPVWRACPDPETLDAVYVTHHHPDHVFGLVPVLERWGYEGRRKPLAILTTAWGIGHLRRLFEAGLMAPEDKRPFPIVFQVAAETPHLGPFRLAIAPTQHAAPNHALRLERDGRSFAYSGDGRPTPESLELYAGASLLLHECYIPDQADGMSYHCDLPTVRRIQGPERIGVYHVQAGQRPAMRAAIAGDARLFMPEAGTRLTL